MKKFTIKATCAALALVLGATAFTGCGAKVEKLDGTATAMVIDGVEVPAGVASFAVRYQQTQMEYYYTSMFQAYGMDSSSIWDQEFEEGVTLGDETRNSVIEELQKMYIVREKADELGIEITEEESTAMDEAAKAFIEANEAETLEVIGVSESDVREYLELTTYYDKAFEPAIADVEITVSNEEAAQSALTYAFKSTRDMEDAEKEEAYTMMEGLLEDVKASENPATADIITMGEELDESIITMDYNYSVEPSEDEAMDAALREAADSLKDGEVYDGVVEGESGYFVVRKDAELDEEATEEKIASMMESKRQEAFSEIVQGWFDAATIEAKEVLDQIQLTDLVSFTMPAEETAEETIEEVTEE